MFYGARIQLEIRDLDTDPPKVAKGIFQPVDSGYYKEESCSIPECMALTKRFAGEPWPEHGYFIRQEIRFVHTLPPYIIERYVRVLGIWRSKRCYIPTLLELCVRRVNGLEISLSPWFLPRRNYIIHRVFRRMLAALNEAVLYEAAQHPHRIFAQYSNVSHSLLQGWINRNEHLRVVKCPLHRFVSRRHFLHGANATIGGYVPEFPDDDVDRCVKPHQCGYMRCTCAGYVDMHPPSMSENKARMRKLIYDSGVSPTYQRNMSMEKKVPKAKLRTDRLERHSRRR